MIFDLMLWPTANWICDGLFFNITQSCGYWCVDTSGYKGYHFESPMIENLLKGRNDFFGVTKTMVLDKVKNLDMDKGAYDFNYSNFGYAVLVLVLEEVYKKITQHC